MSTMAGVGQAKGWFSTPMMVARPGGFHREDAYTPTWSPDNVLALPLVGEAVRAYSHMHAHMCTRIVYTCQKL